MSLKYNMYIHCYYIEFNDCTSWDFQCKAKKSLHGSKKHLLKYSFGSCTVLEHNKSTLANVSFLQERLVKSNCLPDASMVTMGILLRDSPAVLADVQTFPRVASILPIPVISILGAQM